MSDYITEAQLRSFQMTIDARFLSLQANLQASLEASLDRKFAELVALITGKNVNAKTGDQHKYDTVHVSDGATEACISQLPVVSRVISRPRYVRIDAPATGVLRRFQREAYDSDGDSDTDADDFIPVRVVEFSNASRTFSDRSFTSPRSFLGTAPITQSESVHRKSLQNVAALHSVSPLLLYLLGDGNDFHSLFVNNSNDATCYLSFFLIYGDVVSFGFPGNALRLIYDPGGITTTSVRLYWLLL